MQELKSFTDLTTWQEAHKLVLLVYNLTRRFPKEETFGLTSQIRRAAVSVTSNLAEGYGRKHSKEKLQFYQISIGSLFEIENQIMVARDVGYISEPESEKVLKKTVASRKLCYGLIRSINDSI